MQIYLSFLVANGVRVMAYMTSRVGLLYWRSGYNADFFSSSSESVMVTNWCMGFSGFVAFL